jgi:uncharacterized protein (TIGR00251 family)
MTHEPVSQSDRGVVLRVLVKTNSRERRLVSEVGSDYIVVNLMEAPHGGRANSELVKRLSKLFGLSTSAVTIDSGSRSRDKVVLVRERTKNDVMSALTAALNA